MSKPWLKKKDEKVVYVEGCKIVLQPISFGDSRKAIQKAIDINPMTGKSNIDPTLLGVLRALAQIKDWDLTDENEEKLPITMDTFDNILDEDFCGMIIKKVNENVNQVSETEKKN